MKTLVGSPEPEEPERPEIVWVVTTLGSTALAQGFLVQAEMACPSPVFVNAATNTTTSATWTAWS